MKKNEYVAPEITVILLQNADIITRSGNPVDTNSVLGSNGLTTDEYGFDWNRD